jgi:hypothetical protein
MKNPDFTFNDVGTIVFLRPLSKKALKWSSDNINVSSWQNPVCIEIEPRMFEGIKEGILNEGLTIEIS